MAAAGHLPRTRAAIAAGVDDGLHIGAQLAASIHGETVAALAVGHAGNGHPMGPDTLLPWFSCTKPITATAVLQLWDRGLVDLDEPVARHVPGFGVEGKGGVTIRHLLTHTSGLPEVGTDLGAILGARLRWEPGTRAAYVPQSAYHLLGELVRRVDGRELCAYATEEVLELCGMADAWMAMPAERHRSYGARMGVMHETSGDRAAPTKRHDRADVFERCWPSSGLVAPAADVVRFFEMLLGGGAAHGFQVLQPATVTAMTSRQREGMRDETFGQELDWGLGVMVNVAHRLGRPGSYGYGGHASRDAFGHGGVQSSVAFADPAHGLACAVVFNGRPGEAANHRRTQPVLTALYEDLGLASQRS